MTEYKSLSDSELFDRLKQDDHAAYTEIYKRYNLVLLGHAYNQTRNREEAKCPVLDLLVNHILVFSGL